MGDLLRAIDRVLLPLFLLGGVIGAFLTRHDDAWTILVFALLYVTLQRVKDIQEKLDRIERQGNR